MTVKQSAEIVAYDPALFPTLREQDPAEIAARFDERFKRAENMDDLWRVLEGNTSQALAGHVLEIKSVSWVPFESDRGVVPNAICNAVDVETGEVVEFATTSYMLTRFLRSAELVGGLPFTARIVAKKTRSGQTALNFEQA